ncbi:unnamed protein product [Symbiodinium pilosum]|uniref:Uncharacterized protein n=1 Tax=Symbiodinium pilosum TaxID=2952 RepID=A0A812RND7_SYMPI|nr:unnamed protein product [Symbiodinium pilosum]
MTVPKPAASAAELGGFIHLHPQLQQEIEEPESEELLFNRVVSDNVLLRPKNLSESVRNVMASKPKNNSDAILALREVRELLLEEVVGHGHLGPDDYTRGGVKTCKQRMPIEGLVQDKFYEGKIVKKTRAGLMLDLNAECLGLLRWRLLKGVPKKLQKVGGFLANLLVTKIEKAEQRVILKLQGIGFSHDTIEETRYKDIYGYVHHWSELPGAPPYARLVPPLAEADADSNARVNRPLAPRDKRLARWGKNGPRSS